MPIPSLKTVSGWMVNIVMGRNHDANVPGANEWEKNFEDRYCPAFEQMEADIDDGAQINNQLYCHLKGLYRKLLEQIGAAAPVDTLFATGAACHAWRDSYTIHDARIRTWLNGATRTSAKPDEASLFFTGIMCCLTKCRDNMRGYLSDCLSELGAEELLDPMIMDELCPETGTAYTDRAGTAITLINYALLSIAGLDKLVERDRKKYGETIAFIGRKLRELFSAELMSAKLFSEVTKTWHDDLSRFIPRSSTLSGEVELGKIYVYPSFCRMDDSADMTDPISIASGSPVSRRILVRGRTGMGKSMYLRTIALAAVRGLFPAAGNDDPLRELSEAHGLPDDKAVIFIPARMFSFCYENADRMEWTQDLAEVYFKSVICFGDTYNFYSEATFQRGVLLNRWESLRKALRINTIDDVPLEALKKRLAYLARKGRLLVLIDSFDEIVSGDMRSRYITALDKFRKEYCQPDTFGKGGAHLILTSREMSPATMKALTTSMSATDQYEVLPLSVPQQEELIGNWSRWLQLSDEDAGEMRRGILTDHLCEEFSVNPYMLSVICMNRRSGLAYGGITGHFIDTLIQKTRNTAVVTDRRAGAILMSDAFRDILKSIAWHSIENDPHFSAEALNDEIRSRFRPSPVLGEEQISEITDTLKEIFVTAVGLIVPADGEDLKYQFINDQIRYRLAAEGLFELVRHGSVKAEDKFDAIMRKEDGAKEYTGLLLPLLSKGVNAADYELAEKWMSDLALRDVPEEDEEILTGAMLDLILGRYGENIATEVASGDIPNARIARRAQRLLIYRLFSSAAFAPTEEEKAQIRDCNAYINAEPSLSARLTQCLS